MRWGGGNGGRKGKGERRCADDLRLCKVIPVGSCAVKETGRERKESGWEKGLRGAEWMESFSRRKGRKEEKNKPVRFTTGIL